MGIRDHLLWLLRQLPLPTNQRRRRGLRVDDHHSAPRALFILSLSIWYLVESSPMSVDLGVWYTDTTVVAHGDILRYIVDGHHSSRVS